MKCLPLRCVSTSRSYHEMRRDIAAFIAPVTKKVRETCQGIERAEEQEEGEPEELVEDGEKSGDESEGTGTERDTP